MLFNIKDLMSISEFIFFDSFISLSSFSESEFLFLFSFLSKSKLKVCYALLPVIT